VPFEPVTIIGVISDEISQPANDGRRGSALYAVPIRLSRGLSWEEARLITALWDRPPQFTTMHRLGIARVSGDRVVLDGTTVDEVAQYHAKTLSMVVEGFNVDAAEAARTAEDETAARRSSEEEHRRHVEDVAKNIRFQ